MDEDGLRLPDTMSPIEGLLLDGGVPPGIEEEHVIGGGEIEPRASCLEASRTIDRIFENSRTSEPLHVPKTPVASAGRPVRSSRAWQV